MVFSSIIFIFYFLPLFLLAYLLIGKNYKNGLILVASIFFYSWGAPKFIFVILGTTLLDFFLVRWMSNTDKRFYRRLMLTLSVSVNLGLLIYFKYSNFFIENINGIITSVFHAKEITWTKLVLPLGISFYTFETITYVVDVYRGIHKPLKNFWDYQLYIILFPKLIAGPIIRYHELADQITDRSEFETNENRLMGLYRFAIGLGKKVLIANVMGEQANLIFGKEYGSISLYTAWLGALAYTFQIYFDFSGYSDMAIGLGKIMGFRFPENFNNPYTSRSITEFWRRWHITLGNWMKNYLYIPLGGNRVNNKFRLYFNLWLVFLASGLWHGASWSFVFWGAYHGFFLVIERMFLLKVFDKIGKLLSTLITFIIVATGWVFFRVEKLSDAFIYLQHMFGPKFIGGHLIGTDLRFWVLFSVSILFSFFTFFKRGQKIQDTVYFDSYTVSRHTILASISVILIALCSAAITSTDFNPFIYFRF